MEFWGIHNSSFTLVTSLDSSIRPELWIRHPTDLNSDKTNYQEGLTRGLIRYKVERQYGLKEEKTYLGGMLLGERN